MDDTFPAYRDADAFTQVAEIRTLVEGVTLPYLHYSGPAAPADLAARHALLRAYCSEIILRATVWAAHHLQHSNTAHPFALVHLRFTELRLFLPHFYYDEEEGLPSDAPHFDDLSQRLQQWHDLVLVGAAGSGKTTALQQLAFELARDWLTGDTNTPLPVSIDLAERHANRDGVGMLQDALARAELTDLNGRQYPLVAHRLLAPLLPELIAMRLALLWDGLDEVPRGQQAATSRAIEAFRRSTNYAHLHLVTCRSDRYPQSSVHSKELDIMIKKAAIEALEPAAVREGVVQRLGDTKGYVLLALLEQPNAAAQVALAHNPLFLQMLCEMYAANGALPASQGRLLGMFVALRLANTQQYTTAALARFALAAIAMCGRGSAVALEWALEVLRPVSPVDPQQILEQARQAGLLIVGSVTVRFSHVLLQEYCAALALRDLLGGIPFAPTPPLGETPPLVLPPAPNWQQGWEETLLLLASLDGAQHANWQAVRAALQSEPLVAAKLIAAGSVSAEPEIVGLVRSIALAQVGDTAQNLRQRLAAGEALGIVGDPRTPIDITEWLMHLNRRSEEFGRLDSYWCYVRPGMYRIGGWKEEQADSTRELTGFWIAQLPITVAQYAPFVQQGYGVDAERWWTPAGRVWQRTHARSAPDHWDVPAYTSPSQPVVGVSWYEAMAYCAWLNQQLSDALPPGLAVRLPTEAEWEAAAAFDVALRRPYPWGHDAPTLERAIFSAARLNVAAPVGACPAGAAACGALDMLGNVEEWCCSWYSAYPAGSDNGAEDAPWGGNIQLGPVTTHQLSTRGGWFAQHGEQLGCGQRFWRYASASSSSIGFRVVLARSMARRA